MESEEEASVHTLLNEFNYPWSSNLAIAEMNKKKEKQFEDNVGMLIEYFFQQFKKGNRSYQQVTIPGGFVIDLKYMR